MTFGTDTLLGDMPLEGGLAALVGAGGRGLVIVSQTGAWVGFGTTGRLSDLAFGWWRSSCGLSWVEMLISVSSRV